MDELTKEKVNLETAKIHWKDLQRFFAKGEAVWVSSELDLVEVGYQFSIDSKSHVQAWMENNQVALVSDAQALTDVVVYAPPQTRQGDQHCAMKGAPRGGASPDDHCSSKDQYCCCNAFAAQVFPADDQSNPHREDRLQVQ